MINFKSVTDLRKVLRMLHKFKSLQKLDLENNEFENNMTYKDLIMQDLPENLKFYNNASKAQI